MPQVLRYRVIDSPIGPLLLAGDRQALKRLAFMREGEPEPDAGWQADTAGVLDGVCRELDAYFGGRLTRFATMVAPDGTPFQRRVWAALCEIPYGRTVSYGELAHTIGAEKAVRASALPTAPTPSQSSCRATG